MYAVPVWVFESVAKALGEPQCEWNVTTRPFREEWERVAHAFEANDYGTHLVRGPLEDIRRATGGGLPLIGWFRSPEAGLLPELRVIEFADGGSSALCTTADLAQRLEVTELARTFDGYALVVNPPAPANRDPDFVRHGSRKKDFGFSWFVPELLKHRGIWHEVLLASLVVQLLGLGLPLITQAVIDKVVVHRTQSTLIVLAIAMGVFAIFSALMSWARQYLILHTGNRVDAALGGHVFDHLLRLPLGYFQARSTGVVSARLHGVEQIREFLASAAVTAALDIPFLLIFVSLMFWYSAALTCIVLAILGLIIGMSVLVAPVFQRRLNEQFLRGARNQAFVTEYVAAMETVKSLQLEDQLSKRYSDLLADYLKSGFALRQIGNTYNVISNLLEQAMTMLILCVGAWTVMTTDPASQGAFTIGMLIAFNMLAQRVSQPMLRLVGLWQQFQQASLSIKRLGDLVNSPREPYTQTVRRLRPAGTAAEIAIDGLAFRYNDKLPLLYRNLSFTLKPGLLTVIMGASGCGKSTLAKLLQGFVFPSEGRIRLDGVDIGHLSANELRRAFGIVPQETVIFAGTVRDNLQMIRPDATFEDIVFACEQAQIHEFISGLPAGYDTELGERGVGLSGGQKQRLAIARALLKKPQVLIFDEATANLDAESVEGFVKAVNGLKGSTTIIYITHALPRSLALDQLIKLGPKPEFLSVVPNSPVAGTANADAPRLAGASA